METQNCNQNGQKIGIVMVPLPAQGHLNQLLHLSHLISSYAIPVHFAGSAIHNRQAKLRLQGRDPETSRNIQFHDLHLPPYTSPNPNSSTHFPAHLQPLFDAWTHLREPMFQLLQHLSTKFTRLVIIHDFIIGSVVQDAKLIPNAETYVFCSVHALHIFMGIWESLTEKPFQLDSDIPTFPPLEDNVTPQIKDFVYKQREFMNFQCGALFNACRLIDGKYLELLQRLPIYANMKFFAIGPLNPVEVKIKIEKQTHKCLEWLDEQEAECVIYVSFGSSTSISDEQVKELAKGLEDSEQKFIWVLRKADKGDNFIEDEGELELPDGFEERVKNRGMVIRGWAPQLQILGHISTGGFMSHCGWNSCMESISMGVPIAAWPMHSEQPRNAVYLTQVLRIGMMVRDWARRDELVKSNIIEDVVRRLMASKEGEEMRKRAVQLGEVVRGSVAKGGASRLEMDSFIAHITR